MNCPSKKYFCFRARAAGRGAFTLAETAAAIMVLAIICGGIFTIFHGSARSAANSVMKIQAFEVAQGNMERVLASSSVSEGIEYGVSEKYPAIEWQTSIETFYEPMTRRLWARAVCSANYNDSDNLPQKVELTNWITDLSQAHIFELIKRKAAQKALLAQTNKLINTIEDAAAYAGVDTATIQQWLDNGMPVTEDGLFIKDYLDLYKKNNGNPPADQKAILDNYFSPVFYDSDNGGQSGAPKPGDTTPPGGPKPNGPTPKPSDKNPKDNQPPKLELTALCGLTIEQLNQMPFEELWKFLQSCPEALQ